MRVARSSWFAMMSSYQRRSSDARSRALCAAHAGKAAAAVSMARRVSVAPMSGTVPIGSRGAGVSTGWGAPEGASTHLPPRKARVRRRSGSRSFMAGSVAFELGALILRRFRTGEVAREEIQRAGARQCRGRCVVAVALLAVETVAGALVDVHRGGRLRRADVLDVAQRNALVGASIVVEHRTAGLLR